MAGNRSVLLLKIVTVTENTLDVIFEAGQSWIYTCGSFFKREMFLSYCFFGLKICHFSYLKIKLRKLFINAEMSASDIIRVDKDRNRRSFILLYHFLDPIGERFL